jgi:ethanolamine transporter EutH
VQDGKADIATTRDVWDLTTLISGYTLGPPIVHLLATALALPGPHFPVALAGATVGFGLGRIRWWWIHRP